MREIKFRLRYKDRIIGYETWGKGRSWWLYKKAGENLWDFISPHHTEKNLYTGKHDKNGKEIYEGDIVKMLSRNLSQVYFRDSGFCVDVGGLTIGFHPDYLGRYKTVEVVGNIYENPELLKEKEAKCKK